MHCATGPTCPRSSPRARWPGAAWIGTRATVCRPDSAVRTGSVCKLRRGRPSSSLRPLEHPKLTEMGIRVPARAGEEFALANMTLVLVSERSRHCNESALQLRCNADAIVDRATDVVVAVCAKNPRDPSIAQGDVVTRDRNGSSVSRGDLFVAPVHFELEPPRPRGRV